MRFPVLLVAFLAACGGEEPPCGELEERPLPEAVGWCLDDYQPARLCCDGAGCAMLLDYDDGSNDTAAVTVEDGKSCGTETECLAFFDEVEAWCAWNEDPAGEPPPAPSL